MEAVRKYKHLSFGNCQIEEEGSPDPFVKFWVFCFASWSFETWLKGNQLEEVTEQKVFFL